MTQNQTSPFALKEPLARMAGTPLISTQQVSIFYGERPALKDVSFSVAEGDVTALVGPSGSGKTSFLTCLNRLTDLIPSCHVTGSIRFGGQEVLAPSIDVLRLRRRIGMIFQKPNPFPFSIWKNLALPLQEHGMTDSRHIETLVQQSLVRVGLWEEVRDRLHSPALMLSGGQQQRLCIARALILSPEVLLMDEPCSALDPLSSGVVEDLITELRHLYTIVIVTHNLAQARRLADHVALFWVQDGTGQLIESQPNSGFFQNPQHELTKEYINGVRG